MRIEPAIQRLATGYRINQAKDDPAGLAISQQMQGQINGLNQGQQNNGQSQDALKVADSALSGINENLQRIRELALQAGNGILTGDEKNIIQDEINALKNGIAEQVKGAEFNTKPLLDGSFKNVATGTQPDGSGATLNIPDMRPEALGIGSFDVTGSFNLNDVDSAIQKVTEARGNIGAQVNGLESNARTSATAAENVQASQSRIADADIAGEVVKLNQANLLRQYQLQTQRMQQNQQKSTLDLLL